MKKYTLFLIVTIICVGGFQIGKVEAKSSPHCGSGSHDIGGGWCQYYNCGNVYDYNGNKGADWPSCGGSAGSCSIGSASGGYSSGDYYYWTCTTWFQGVSVGQPASCSYYTPPPTPPVNGTCGSLNGTFNPIWPSSGWCNAGSQSGLTQIGSSNVWNWTCLGSNGGASSPTCQFTNSCPTGQTYCSATSSCILNSLTCGGGGDGGCFSPKIMCPDSSCSDALGICSPKCSISSLTASTSPAFVADPSKTCSINWNSSGTDVGNGGICTRNITCTLDGNNTNVGVSGSISGLSVGTHTISCKDSDGVVKTSSVKCKVAPSYGEF